MGSCDPILQTAADHTPGPSSRSNLAAVPLPRIAGNRSRAERTASGQTSGAWQVLVPVADARRNNGGERQRRRPAASWEHETR